MMNLRSMSTVVALASVMALPALAQTAGTGTATRPATPPAATTSPAVPTTGGPAAPVVEPTRSYTTADNHMRASKIIGSSVYNEQRQKVGTVDELLMSNGRDLTN